MSRPLRTDFPGAFHHVTQRGARRAPIFARPDDCVLLLDTLDDGVHRFGTEVHAYSLMPNHFHVLVRSTHGDLSRFMQFVDGQYTRRLNLRHRWDGPVFRGRFHNQLLASPAHLRVVLPYLHLNPVRARLVKDPAAECWTSHRAYLGIETPPRWLTTSYFRRLLGGRRGLAELVTGLHEGRVAWPADFDLASGWFTENAEPEDSDDTGDAAESDENAGAAMGGGGVGRGEARPTAAEVLERVVAITGSSLEELREAKFGPRANPARRFATWALVRHAGLAHSAVGEALNMTTTAVGKVVWRLGKQPTDEVRAWMKRWDKPVGRGAKR